MRSTDKDRALMSAYAHLAGLYPPDGSQIWNPSVSWQPIAVHSVELFRDFVSYSKLNLYVKYENYSMCKCIQFEYVEHYNRLIYNYIYI